MERLNLQQIRRAAELLKQGKLVAFPTETVYGLGAKISDPEAIKTLFRTKGRPSDNPLIAHAASLGQIEQIAREIPPLFYRLAAKFFPGPLTVILKRHPSVPSIVSAGLDSIAIRIPAHSVAIELIAQVGEPLVAPSANLSGKPSATQAIHVIEDFEGKISAVLDGGATEIGIESTVISLLDSTPRLLRPGIIDKEEIEEVLQISLADLPLHSEGVPLSPGMKYRHYAPYTPMKLFLHRHELERYLLTHPSKRRMILAPASFSQENRWILSAREFYSHLRHADREGYEEILLFCDESIQQNKGLMNRIFRSIGT